MSDTTNVVFSLSSIWSFALTIIASMGGGAIIIGAIVKYTSDIIADRLHTKYQLQINKEIEQYKSGLGTKQHISVKRFDTEYEVYQELSGKFFEAERDCGIMIPAGYTLNIPADRDQRLRMDASNYEKALKSVAEAQDCLHSHAPFIKSDHYKGYLEILMLFNLQLNAYLKRFNAGDFRPKEEKEQFSDNDYMRTVEIGEKIDKLNEEIRIYFEGLEVV